ncbi:hypothetical protein RBA41_28240 [Massilia sp. CCM 9210]|uniref:hypothetical protein n=1 Tax=Massilia scottii TaxID=3057166 RepID=UPI0027965318|nr:hypothetical protein [Massilia sp. CCM 9210]MDQ1817200.1 hypothetical protein [Massilia sp. CCM 9210]
MLNTFVGAAHVEVIRQVQDFLRDHPKEKGNSAGEVARRLEIEHMGAALWLEKRHGMSIDMHNLHNLIEFWPTARMLATAAIAGGAAAVATTETFGPDEFNPAHLIEYFVTGAGKVAAAAQH